MINSKNIFENIINSVPKQEANEGDYYKDGFLHCGICHTRKETEITVLDEVRRVNCICKCEKERREREEQERRAKEWLKHAIEKGIADPEYLKWRMEADDGKNPDISKAVKNYVDHWDEMKEDNIGILFHGSVGTGKTFYAANIANGLLDKGVAVLMTNLPTLMSRLTKGFEEDREKVIKQISTIPMLIIDDVGIERDTAFAIEKIQEIIDTRYRAGKPLIVTTNLSVEEMVKTTDIRYQRIFNRIIEMCCVPIKVEGISRRLGKAAKKTAKAKGILGI